LEDVGVDNRIILKQMSLNKQDVMTRTGYIWLRSRTTSRFLWTQYGTFRFYTMWGLD